MTITCLCSAACPLFHIQETIVNRALKAVIGIVLPVALLAQPAAAESPAVKAMQEYMEFAPYEAGIIVPQQLAKDAFESVVFIDTRDAGQFAKGTIAGARNIEWREVLTRIGEIPKDKKVVLFCNTGSLSAQAAFALRVAGRENVLVLQTGIDGWRKDAAYKP
jgi:rhodanese-related sulfurtransferase